MTSRIFTALTVLCLLWASAGDAQTSQPVLMGTIDIHVHSDPDNRPRSIDAIDVAKLARDRGMRAIVLKNHYDPTGPLAYVVRKEVPGIEVFGGVDLNLPVGGINACLLYTSPSPRDRQKSRMPSSA